MRTRFLLLLMFIFVVLFSSCSSIYVDTPEPTYDPDITSPVVIEEGDEYFTEGRAYNYGNIQYGHLYYDYWIYEELQDYKVLSSVAPNGNKVYSGSVANRLVKVNTATGAVSSLCLDPVCNHSPGSGCDMLAPVGGRIYIPLVVKDWLVVEKGAPDEVYGARYETFSYNPLTGEKRDILINEYNETSMLEWIGKTVFGNKLYSIKKFMDYSETGYVPGGDKPMADFKPKTVCVLCYYDFDENKTVELFEVPEGYATVSASNKRIFLKTPKGEYVSYDFDGNNMAKEDVLDFSPENKIGTFAYDLSASGFDMYDLKTNTKTTFKLPFTGYQFPTFTNSGIIYDTFTTIDEWASMRRGISDYIKEHPEMSMAEASEAYTKLTDAVRYSGKAQIWRSDFEGKSLELIFEIENAHIQSICGNDKVVFGFVTRGDPNNGFAELPRVNEGRSMINLETGEITPIPYLDLIDDYDLYGE